MQPSNFPLVAGKPFPTAQSFMEYLASAARRRWQVQLTAPDGLVHMVRPLFRIPAGKLPPMFGVSGQPVEYDRWLCITAGPIGEEDTAPLLRYQILYPGWYSHGPVPVSPTLAPEPLPMKDNKRATVIMESLAWAARLGVWAQIWYGALEQPELRRLADLRIAPGDGGKPSTIKAIDTDKSQPRSFSIDKIDSIKLVNLIAYLDGTPPAWCFDVAEAADFRADRHPHDPQGMP